jgi:hypothetical protein
MEDDKSPKGLTPLESSFLSSDVSNKETRKEEESKRKVGDTISLNLGTFKSPKMVKLGAQCSDEEKAKFTELLREFQDVFAWSYEDLCGFDHALIQHAIPIKERIIPVRKKQRPINPTLEDTIRKEFEKILKDGIIFPIKYPYWVSNLFHVRKTTGHIRLCVDFRALNRASVKYHFPLPNMEMILQHVARSQMLSLLDGFSRYNQIKVKRTDRYKTTFTTRWGTFPYERMPFDLSNAGATFQRAMQIAFDDLIGKIIQVYLDDLIVYSKNRLDHFGHLRKVLMRCRKFGISLNPSKSIFGVTKGKLLGHVVSNSGISIDPERIAAILNLPAPTSKKEVQAFIGIINFVRRFVPDFALMVKPIHNLLKKYHSFSWTYEVENTFLRIKKGISFALVLAKSDFEKKIIIYTNATEEAVYVIFLQCDDQNNEKHVAYMSQSLLDDEFKYSYIEKHAFVLVKAIEKFHHFIIGKHTQIKVPLPVIKFFISQTYISGKLERWLAKIQDHDFIQFCKKKKKVKFRYNFVKQFSFFIVFNLVFFIFGPWWLLGNVWSLVMGAGVMSSITQAPPWLRHGHVGLCLNCGGVGVMLGITLAWLAPWPSHGCSHGLAMGLSPRSQVTVPRAHPWLGHRVGPQRPSHSLGTHGLAMELVGMG